jgi:hypothetical protein
MTTSRNKMVGTRSLSSGAHSRDPLALPTLRDDWIASLTFAMTAIPATPTILRSMLATRHFEISQGGKSRRTRIERTRLAVCL